MTTHFTDDSDSDVELAPEYSPISSPASISTENGNKYNNQLHYYEVHGWPEWRENSPLAQILRDISESHDDSGSREYEDKGVQATMEHIMPAQVTTCSCYFPQVPETAGDSHAVNVAEDAKGVMRIEDRGVGQGKRRGLDIRSADGAGVDKENILPRASHSLGKRAAVTSLEGSKKRRKE
ncbi:hypothetical protein FIBSPDRAFT_944696 [Athelia psychrophila]|uniref:Uncharacterized protein n=1 Tax=Athelia psychrophila TaxID=1759441 RepID=A0A166UXM9_9AGAM|nr:hypothetical protein FIBSPDRAFT_944696 [Fibularhizoctonia sp. CBS 109695]